LFVFFLDEIYENTDAVTLVGGKAHALGRLAKAGFPVPPGFCLTADAYRHHLAANNLAGEIKALLARPTLSDDEKARLVRQAISGANLPLGIQEAVIEVYRVLTGGAPLLPVAVRSSALTEDTAEASFAGQHDTFLNVRGESALLESIKHCWASLWTARSLSYRTRLQPDASGAALAVLVQRMVPADYAGVAFTINPITGADEIVLEVTTGLGERLVSGSVTPDRYRMDKRTWEVHESSSARRGHAILNPARLRQVARLATKVERFFGHPQDIEWAQSSGHTYLLQSRPVTAMAYPGSITADGQVDMDTLLHRAEAIGSEIWTDDNVGEVIPGVVTPLSWSVLEPLGNEAFCSFLGRVGVRRYPAAGLFGRFYGRIYFNQSQFQRLMRRFYPSHLSQIGGGRSRLLGLSRAAVSMAETGLRALLLMPTLPRQAERSMKAIPTQLEHAPPPETLTDQELWAEAERWRQIGQQAMSVHLAVTIFAMLLYSLLEKFGPRWSDGTVETAHLFTGLPDMKSAEMGRDLAALADEVAAAPDLRDCLFDDTAEALGDCVSNLSPDNRFARQLDEFLDEYGHASLREFELAFPRWREDASHVLTMLQSHLRARHDGHTVPSPKAQQTIRLCATENMRRRLRIGPRRLFFEVLLRWTQQYSLIRENLKYTFVMAHSDLRELYLALAARLIGQGALSEVADLFYLTRKEIAAFLAGQSDEKALAGAISGRRTEHRLQVAKAEPPKIIEQRSDGSLHAVTLSQNGHGPDETSETDVTTLNGVAASPGRVTGRARVILDLRESARLEHGEILVTPSTNPAWAPLLLNASALVTEVGGLLSHGAIVAREYGLPAVLNVANATRRIRTCQLIRVDGFKGVVQLLEEGEREQVADKS